MSEILKLETRLDLVEKEVADLKRPVFGDGGTRPWYERMVGSMRDYPEFGEVVRLGREFRKTENGSQHLPE